MSFLLDREIKQETEDFLQNVKEEPIDEDEYSEPIIPKQETEESLENVKTEANDDDYSYLNMTSTLSRMESEEPKPDDSLLDREIKEETEDLSEKVKKECEEENYSEQIMTKIGVEIDPHQPMSIPESTETTKPNSQAEKFSIEAESAINTLLALIPKRRFRRQKDQRFRNCSVCLQLQSTQNMKHVTLEEEKQIVMIGYYLSCDCSLTQAQQFMSRKKIESFICYTHFPKTVKQIFK